MQRSSSRARHARAFVSAFCAVAFIGTTLGVSQADTASITKNGSPRVSARADARSASPRPVERDYDDSKLPARFDTTGSSERWYESGVDAGPTANCLYGYGESLGRSWVGWYGNLGTTPTTGQVYYTKIGWGVAGNPCGGGAYVHVEEFLPAGTQLAISGQNPVMCWYEGLDADDQMAREINICPQTPQAGVQGGYSFDPSDGSGAWPTATGAIWEIWIPVKSTQPLDGMSRTPCNTCLQAGVWMIDGVNSPWSYPKSPVYVKGSGGGGTTAPSISYPAPSVRAQQCCPGPNGQAYAETVAWLFTQGKTGTAQFEIDYDGAPYEFTSPPLEITSATLQQWGNDLEISNAWNFDPDKNVYWRLCFTHSGGTKTCGKEQVFLVEGPPDTVPPQTSIVDRPKRLTNARSASFSLASNELPARYECQIDGSPFSACMNPTYKDLAEGKHSFAVFAIDEDGNSDLTPASYTWTVDLTKPQTTITRAPRAKTSKTSASFEFTANEARSTFQCKLDAGGWKSCSSPASYTGLARKQHTFSVRATDRAGNTDGSPASKSWTVTR